MRPPSLAHRYREQSLRTGERVRPSLPGPLMPFPQQPRKWEDASLFDPAHYLAYLRSRGREPSRVPPSVILGWNRPLLEYVERRYGLKDPHRDGPYSRVALPRYGGQVGFLGSFGIGAPAMATVVEELLALGARQIVGIGTAGSLQPALLPGSLVVCTKALRDEGTSHHYLRPSRFAWPSPGLTREVGQALADRGLRFRRGGGWTVDAVYRETVRELRRWRRAGLLTVDMEASALFSVARFRRAKAASVFVISDVLDEAGWRPRFHAVRDELVEVFEAVATGLRRNASRK